MLSTIYYYFIELVILKFVKRKQSSVTVKTIFLMLYLWVITLLV